MSNYSQINSSELSRLSANLLEVNSSAIKIAIQNIENVKPQMLAMQELVKNLNLEYYNQQFIDLQNSVKNLLQIPPTFSEEIKQLVFDFTKISNRFDLDYSNFYQTRFNFETGSFKTNEDEKTAYKFEEKVLEYKQVRKKINQKIIEIKFEKPELVFNFNITIEDLMSDIKKDLESYGYELFKDYIGKKELKKNRNNNQKKLPNITIEKFFQKNMARFLNMYRIIINRISGNYYVDFRREPQIWEKGYLDFDLTINFPTPQKIAVEVKPIFDLKKLDKLGEPQIIDYMIKDGFFSEGYRLVLNGTGLQKPNKTENIKGLKITSYFINIWQPTSSSLNFKI